METIVLTGNIDLKDIPQYNDLISKPDVKEIDISGISIDGGIDRVIDHYMDESPLPLFVKLYLNKEFSSFFVIEDGLVLSKGRDVLVSVLKDNINKIPNSVHTIGHFAFYCNDLKSIEIPNGITRIGDFAFCDCDKLEKLSLPDSVEHLGESAFDSCGIENIKLSKKLKTIPPGCFAYNFLNEIDIPSSVKEIGGWAFAFNFIYDVILPEGVETIGSNAFEIGGKIYIPSTMKTIARDFYYEECIDIPQEHLPYIEVSEKNPIFFSKNGTLYSYDNPNEPYLGYEYIEENEREEKTLIVFPDSQTTTPKYPINEIMDRYHFCKPINDDNSLFLIYESQNGRYNIIDRTLHHYINADRHVQDIQFCKNKFILIILESFSSSIIYSIDFKILLKEYDGYHFDSCDNEGRIYVTKYVEVPPERLHIHYYNKTTPRTGCITVDKDVIIPCVYDGYKDLGHFDKNGIAIAHKGSKYGMIDLHGNICIPFEYHFIHYPFDENDIAFVVKESKGKRTYMYINKSNEVVGIFLDFHFNWSKREFFIYTNNGKYGYAKQGALHYSKAVYEDIRIIDDETIEVSTDGQKYERIKY